jgi:hypothetical protein
MIEEGRCFIRKETDKFGGLEFRVNNDINLCPTRECAAVDPCVRGHKGEHSS